jgi:uncharacterized protein YaiL (DUF2058 family)
MKAKQLVGQRGVLTVNGKLKINVKNLKSNFLLQFSILRQQIMLPHYFLIINLWHPIMALSLQEQLLKAGLADKKKAKQVRQQKHKQAKAQQRHKVVETNEAKLAAEKVAEEKKEKDRKLNQKNKQEAEKKAVLAQIKQLIEVNKQPRFAGKRGDEEVVCNFTDGTVIKRMYVSPATQKQISQGKLAIVKLNEGYELVPMPVANKIAERDDSSVVYRADNISEADQKSSEQDDWYADYDIPDDLNW